MKNDTVLAIFLGIISYTALNIGMALQKKGAASLPKINTQKLGQNIKNFFTCRPWVIGFVLVFLQWISLSHALDLAPVSVITPLMSIGMVALLIFAYFYLKEPITKVELLGILAIIGGIVLLGVTTPRGEEDLTYEDALIQLSSVGAILFLVLFFLLSLFVMILCVVRKYKNADILFSISAGVADALGAVLLRGFMAGADFQDWSEVGAVARLWSWWVLMFVMVSVNFSATIYLQIAYQRGKAVIVAPIFASLAIVIPVFGGILVFNEWQYYFIASKFGLMSGKIVAIFIILAGAILLSIYNSSKRKFDECEDEAEVECETAQQLEQIEPSVGSE
jgi:multidrug transporter EmrE-like cation transporter